MQKRLKIFVGMSGGVDSSVSAALLQKEGHEVIGVFIKVWQADFLPCTWREERREAMRAAAHLNIPLVTLDLEKAYKDEVVDYMIREYREGRVPNPDVMCNKHVKFGAFLDFAKKNGGDCVATGHYAQIEKSDRGLFQLKMGVDQQKDQSYFLWTLDQSQLSRTLFPVGGLEKSEVRKIAAQFGLPNAQKKDSQGLCFMGAIDVKDFLKHYIHTKKGCVLNALGETIGEHDGAMLYTIGQRHGFSTKKVSASESPLFVVSKNIEQNTITVAPELQHSEHTERPIMLRDLNWIPSAPDTKEISCKVRVRYRGELHHAQIIMNDETLVRIESVGASEYIASGQSVVFYESDKCLGGGVIA